MYMEILRDIEGIAVFPVLSLLVFVAVFSAVLIWAARADRQRLDRYAHLPLDCARGGPLEGDSCDQQER